MSAQKVLDRLEEMGILDPQVIGELRRFLDEAKYTVTPEAIVKLLVDKRQLTPFQAKKLIADAYASDKAPSPSTKPAAPAKPTAPPKPPVEVSDDEFMLADEPTKAPAKPAPAKPSGDDILDLEEALPPTPETPIKATIKATPGPSPVLDPDRRRLNVRRCRCRRSRSPQTISFPPRRCRNVPRRNRRRLHQNRPRMKLIRKRCLA